MEKDQNFEPPARGENMAISKAQQKAVNKYVREKYDRINITMPKGRKEIIQAASEAAGQSVNAFINEAVQERLEQGNGVLGGSAALEEPGIVSAHAKEMGETINGFVNRAVSETMGRDKLRQQLTRSKEEK